MFALATVQDVESRLGRKVTSEQEMGRVVALLDDASALVRDVAGTTWIDTDGTNHPEDVPPTIRYVVLRAVDRAMRNPDGFSAESDGDYSYQRIGVEPGIYLTPGEEKAIRRAMGRTGLWTQPLERGDMCWAETVWVNDQFGCDPIPYDVYRNI